VTRINDGEMTSRRRYNAGNSGVASKKYRSGMASAMTEENPKMAWHHQWHHRRKMKGIVKISSAK